MIAIGAEVVGGARLPGRCWLEAGTSVAIWKAARQCLVTFGKEIPYYPFFFSHVYILHVYQENFLVYAEGNVYGDIRHGVALTVKCWVRPRHPSLAGKIRHDFVSMGRLPAAQTRRKLGLQRAND